MRPSICSGLKPVKFQMTEMTGILIFGKISVGVRRITIGAARRISSANTINVYGRERAILTTHIALLEIIFDTLRFRKSETLKGSAVSET
jgi:hypothetical protein